MLLNVLILKKVDLFSSVNNEGEESEDDREFDAPSEEQLVLSIDKIAYNCAFL